MPGMVSGVRGAGVEEIMGFVGSSGGEWYGHAFGFPDRHVLLFWGVGVSGARWFPAVGLGSRGWGPSVWWWFENWIVDASENQNLFFVLFFSL